MVGLEKLKVKVFNLVLGVFYAAMLLILAAHHSVDEGNQDQTQSH